MQSLRLQKSFAVLVFAGAAAFAQTDRSPLAEVPVEQLKVTYLDCDKRASRAVLDPASAKACSLMAEELLQRGFAGNFDALLVWWRHASRNTEQAVTEPPARRQTAALPAV